MTHCAELARFYVLAQPRLLHLLQLAAAGQHPGALMVELYASCCAAASPMAALLELEAGAMELELAGPVGPPSVTAGALADPDTFMARWYVVAERTLELELEAAYAHDAPPVVLSTDLYAAGIDGTDPRVRVLEVPIPAPAMPLEVVAR